MIAPSSRIPSLPSDACTVPPISVASACTSQAAAARGAIASAAACPSNASRSSGSSTSRGPSARTTISPFSAPISSRPPRTSASPAISARLSRILISPFGIAGSDTIQPSWMRRSCPNSPSIADRASRVSTASPNPPAAPKASRKNLSLLADARALSASSSRQRARISGSCSSASSSMPLFNAPTGLNRSWHSREHSRLAKSTVLLDMGTDILGQTAGGRRCAIVLARSPAMFKFPTGRSDGKRPATRHDARLRPARPQ